MSTLIAVSGLGIFCLLLEILNLRKILVPVVLVLLVAILGMVCAELYIQKSFLSFDSHQMIADTSFSRQFSILYIILAIFIVAMCPRFYEDQMVKIADYVSIKIFLLAGAIAMVSFGNMALFFIGLEVLSVSVYILASSRPRDLKSNEAGMKYFIMGAFASSFTLLGITLIYGATGSFNISVISAYTSAPDSVWFLTGMALMTVGLFFKASIVPFHFWAPDVYEGSPTLSTAMMSTLVRVASIGALYKIFAILAVGMTVPFENLVLIASILTMSVGNITAIRQRNIKRMMAYSGISHTGFMIMTLLALNTAANTVLYYAAAYSLAGIAAFSVILSVCRGKKDEDISHFYGLGRKKPLLAVIMSCAMFSMGGLPVFAGFFAKFFAFEQMIAANHLILVVFGVINAIIAIFYYVRVVNVMFTKENESNEPLAPTPIEYTIVGILATLMIILLGIFPSVVIG